ncbi:hypothetical protein BG006_005420 [Podila minutissima]|uniref:PH domain-containing protein n=1 Tax=Podila minutissima TaxID=64525 RepID=A0A9P5VM32_9FUNG|nr:hypothetical protein BG006_005420 [Podila minutissima]
MSALASLDPCRLANRNYDPNADTKLIAIRVRYVSKDLWIRIDIPRNIPVHQARDLILKKCQLTLAPPSAPSSLAETSLQDDSPTPTGPNFPDIDAPSRDIFSGTDTNTESQRALADKLLAPDPNRTPTNKTARKANGSIQTSRSDNSISKSLKSNNSSGSDKEALRSPTLTDDDRRLDADKLVERLAMFSDCLNGIGEQANVNYSGKHFERELPALSDIMADCPDDGPPASESMKKECESWRASFGLFWVANGHWLDDSRLMNSYSLEPHDLLELQLRNHYIQLPPPGGHLNYSDHYAEGVLFKLSKKSRPSLLTGNGKDSTGVWKERWVVLQGTKLLIYHKRKDTTKKTIQLPTPLQMVTRVLPPNSRHQYKFTMSTAATMSSTLIALDMSPDPNAPKLCFRGASENELSHWIRIFNSLNNEDPLRSPACDLDGPASARLDQGLTMGTGLSGFSPERKRNHTSHSIGSNSTTINFISPTLISNAMVAFSNLGNHTQNGHGGDYHRSLSLGAPDRKDAPLLHHPLKEDSRRRAITEPYVMPHLSRNGKTKGPGTESTQPRSMDVSNVSEAPFRLDSPPGRKRRPVLGTEYLDNASQVLLATSSARSSTAPLYSGYIWLYVPPTSKAMGTNYSNSTNESGRYIKCFAAINDHGHFQWVEVKKQTDLETEQESKSEAGVGPTAPPRSSYGIQLKPKKDTNQRLPPPPPSEPSEQDGENPVSRPSSGIVHATMAHKLRLFFFCIRIPQEALAQVMLEMASGSPTSRSQNKTPPSGKARHRLSSSVSALGSSALPPLPSKSQSLSGSVSKGMTKNSTWPAMSPLQQLHQDRPQDGYGALLFPENLLTTSPGSQSQPVGHRRLSTSLKSNKDDNALSPSSSVDLRSSSDVLVRAQFLQTAAALTQQLSVSSSSDTQSQSTLSQPPSSPPMSSPKARLSLGETVSAKKSNIPDSALAYESVIHDRAVQSGPGRLDTNRSEESELFSKCPFLETSQDEGGQKFVTLKGYTETEEGWKILQSALERFIDPIQDRLSALPPEDTLIPSYTFLTSPETRLSEKAEMYLSAKANLLEEANLQASIAAAAVATSVAESLEVRSPTPDQVTVSSAPYGPTVQFKGTSVLHRLMNLSGGGDRDKNKGSTLSPPTPEQYSRQGLFVDTNGGAPGSPLTPTGAEMSIKRGVSPGGALSQSVGTATGMFRPRHRLNQQRSADELTKMAGYYGQSDFKNGIGLGMYLTSTAMGENGSSSRGPHNHRHPRPRDKHRNGDEQDHSKFDEGHHYHHHPGHHYSTSNSNGPVPRSMSLTAATSSHHVNTMVMLTGELDNVPKRAGRSSMYSLQSPIATRAHGGRDDEDGDIKGGIVSGIMDLDNMMSDNHSSNQDKGSRDVSPPSSSSSSGKREGAAKDTKGKFSPLIVSSPRMGGRSIGGEDLDVSQHPFDQGDSRHLDDDRELSKMAQGRDNHQNAHSHHSHHHHHHNSSVDKDKTQKPHTVLGAGKAAVSGVFGKIRKSVG